MNTIVIIGGGASGTITAIRLLEKLQVPTEVILIERNEKLLHRGHAYSNTFSYEPLNVPSGKMSMYNDQPDHFYNWLLAHKPEESAAINLTKASFVSRRWFGDYVEWNLQNAIDNKPATTIYSELIDEVKDIDTALGHYKIKLASGKELNCATVILATGNDAPKSLLSDDDIAVVNNKYANYPWQGPDKYSFNAEDDILIVGSGLTMIDNTVSLKQKGHKGKIYILSRHGSLPLPHAETVHLDVPEINSSSALNIYNSIKHEVKKASASAISWQSVMDSLRTITTPVWKQLSITEKKQFFKYLRPYWEIHRHRMPRESEARINAMKQDGSAVFIKGSIAKVEATNNNITVTYRDKQQEGKITVRYIINCTGPNSDYENIPGHLFNTLAKKALVTFDELKLGIVTAENGSPVNSKGQKVNNVFSVGPVRKASEWETTAIREIRIQAEELANTINSNIEKDYAVLTSAMAL